MAYDTMGVYTGDYEASDPSTETEEQRKLRLQREDAARRAAITQQPAFLPEAATGGPVAPDMANTEVHTQTVKTYGDGSKEEITKRQIPAGQNYNTYTGQQESGNNPNIGFHYPANDQGQRKSSAYGTYGITANAYKDIQAANPAFANRPLESLTADEQTQANNTYRQVLGQQLQAKGVDPTEENTRLAHLLGATGAARYLQNKTVSSQAAAANGGEAKLRQIAEARRAGQSAPASGAAVANDQLAAANQQNRANLSAGIGDEAGNPIAPVQPEMTQPESAPAAPVNPEQALAPGSTYSLAQGGSQPGIRVPGMTTPLTEGTQLPEAQQRFQTNQDNVQELLNMRNDASLPEHLRQRSADRAYELLQNERMKSAAEQKFQSMVAAGDNKGIADAVQGRAKGQEGSWLKMIALGFISPQLAGVEAEKLGLAPTKWEQTTITNEDGTTTGVEIKRSVSGKILEASHMDGSALSSDEMSQLNAMGGKKVHSAQTLINPDTKQVVTQQVLSDGTMRYMAGGRVYTGNKDALIPEAAYTAQVNKKEMAAEKTANKQEEQRQKSEDRRVEGAIKTLEKRIPNPTIEQRKQALVQAGVAAARIEQELGLAEGSLSSRVPVAPVQEAPVQQNRSTAAIPPSAIPITSSKQPVRDETKIGQLGARPVEPAPVEPGPGESAESAKARNKTAQDTYKTELANWEKQKDRFDKREEELPAKQAAIQDSIDLVDRFIKHPGFADIVGVPGVTGILNIPLTDARAARQLYNQIDADTFLRGFDRLRGGGSITEVEGAQAKQAVAALRDRYITEEEFKKNAKLYTDIMKRGINRERQQLGLAPLYPDVKELGPTTSPTPGGGTTSSGNKFKKVQ